MKKLKKKKINVFLGVYINHLNAQNLNGLGIAKYLDKERFEVFAMILYSGRITLPKMPGVHLFQCVYPHRLSRYIGYFWGIWHADIVYLPKGELVGYCYFLAKLLRKKTFSTVEGVFSGTNVTKAIDYLGSKNKMMQAFSCFDHYHSITEFMREVNEKQMGIKTEGVLHIGIESEIFACEYKPLKKGLTDIIFIGNNMLYKGIDEYLKLAENFCSLTFHIVGTGNGLINISEVVKERNLTNVICYGVLNQEELARLLGKVQLHIFPSRFEGFGKVTLEAACVGVPSIVYGDYGAREWITHGVNGFVVDQYGQIGEVIKDLVNHPKKLEAISIQANKLGLSFGWDVKIKQWEIVLSQMREAKHS